MTTTKAQIGRAIAKVLLNPVETSNKYLNITSWLTTQNKVLDICKSLTNAEWQISHVTSSKRHNEGLELLQSGDFLGIGYLWNVWCHTDGQRHTVKREELANEKLQLPEEDMEEVIKGISF
jgi:hypothetical protein